jgi:outer membrane protein assembly factor BamD
MKLIAHGRTSLRLAVLAAASLAIGLTAGCAAGGKGKRDTAYVARDVDTLYMAAKGKLDNGRAQLMSAFSYYAARDYNKSVQAGQRFLSIHPGNKDAPYAYYLVAVCYYEQIGDVTRDQKVTQQALTALNDVVRRYPTTQYASDAKLKIDLVNDHLAGKEMEIGRFYQRSGKWLAATLRFRSVVEKYQQTSHTPEALYRLVESYLSLGIPEEAQKSAAVLGANYPGSEWYSRAFKLMNAKAPGTTAT